ncbi:calcium-dependent phosphotriesterase [Gigaspora margarita]|uniref:Calcium-dependent phosphotriesterase n=1 Tax=Gigaspora margarita TaxID=4874 RepID=A0A8H4EIN4_GIGMA|nr:calcium-dependent phosphotriesterase [Gigaspora margarita]
MFSKIIGKNPKLEVLASKDYDFAHEGGVYVERSNEVFFTSNRLDNNQKTEIYKINLTNNNVSKVTPIPKESILFANGMYYHNDKVIICAQGQGNIGGSIVSLDPKTNETEIIVDNFFGLKFNSPNDIVVSKDGCYWFTDLSYGFEQGFCDKPQLGDNIYRFDPCTGNIRVVADVSLNQMRPHAIYAFDVKKGGSLSNRRLIAVSDLGIPDGIKLDLNGNIYVGTADGVQVFDDSGTLLGKIVIPNGVVNLVFVRKQLIFFAKKTIYSVN